MRIVGKRFWTWMSVWVLSFFVKGELVAEHPEQLTTQESTSTTHQHKSHKAGLDIKKGSQHKMPSPMYTRHKKAENQTVREKMNSGLYDKRKDKATFKGSSTPEIGKTSAGTGLKADGSSKDPAYMKMHKTPNRRK